MWEMRFEKVLSRPFKNIFTAHPGLLRTTGRKKRVIEHLSYKFRVMTQEEKVGRGSDNYKQESKLNITIQFY